jgi:hypothetical protein
MAHPMGSSFKNWQIDAAYEQVRSEQWRSWAQKESLEAAKQLALHAQGKGENHGK